jgi:hypothetical protein
MWLWDCASPRSARGLGHGDHIADEQDDIRGPVRPVGCAAMSDTRFSINRDPARASRAASFHGALPGCAAGRCREYSRWPRACILCAPESNILPGSIAESDRSAFARRSGASDCGIEVFDGEHAARWPQWGTDSDIAHALVMIGRFADVLRRGNTRSEILAMGGAARHASSSIEHGLACTRSRGSLSGSDFRNRPTERARVTRITFW